VLFHVVESTCNPLTVTAEVASSSLVVPAIFSKHLQALTLTDQGILGDDRRQKRIPSPLASNALTHSLERFQSSSWFVDADKNYSAFHGRLRDSQDDFARVDQTSPHQAKGRSIYQPSVSPQINGVCNEITLRKKPGRLAERMSRPQATGVTEYRCTLAVDVQPTGLKPRSTQGIWYSLCPRTRKLQPSPFCEGSYATKGQYIWSVRWYGLIERVQLPKLTRPSLSHLHYTLRSPASRQASARTY